MTTQTEAMNLALEQTLEMLSDNREYIEANERSEYLAMYDKAIAGAKKALAEQPAPVQDRNPYAWHYKNTGGASVWHFGPSNKLDADLEAAKKWPRTHQVTPVFTEQRTQQDCAELEELGWQAVWCPSCGNAGAKGYPRKLTPSLNQLPCGYEHHEHRPYGAPGEVRIHAVLASQYKMPDGTIANDFQWLIDEYKADPNTIKLLPLYATPQAQPAQPLTDEQINLLINGRGDEDDDDYVEPTGDGFGLTDADLVRLVRRVEAALGITKGNT